jgi:ketosteroid isomerase-like protein
MIYLDEKVIQQLVEAFNRRELEPVTKLFSDDVVLHYPGRNQIAGDYEGKLGLLDFWQKQIELTGGSFQGKIVAVCQGEGNLVLLMDANAIHDGQEYTWRRINHYHLAKGRIFEGWIYEGDQYTADIVFA